MLPALIGAGIGAGLGLLNTYEKNKKLDALASENEKKKKARIAELKALKAQGVDNINDSTAGSIVQSSNMAVAQNRGALNIPAVQAIMAARLAGNAQAQIGQYESNMANAMIDTESKYDSESIALQAQKEDYTGNMLQGGFAGAATGINIQSAIDANKLNDAMVARMKGETVPTGKSILNKQPFGVNASDGNTTPTSTPYDYNSMLGINPTTNSNFTALTNPNFRVDSQGRDISTNSLLENPYMQYANPNRQNNSNAINSSSNEYVSPYEKLNGNNGSINGIFKFGQSYNKNVFGKRTFPSFYNQ